MEFRQEPISCDRKSAGIVPCLLPQTLGRHQKILKFIESSRARFAAALLILVCSATNIHAAETKSKDAVYTFGMLTDTVSELSASLFELNKVSVKIITARDNINIEMKRINSKDTMRKEIKAGTYDFVSAVDNDLVLEAMERGYEPFTTLSIYGSSEAAYCIFVRKESEIRDVGQLKNKSITIPDVAAPYYVLRGLAGEPPEDYFSAVRRIRESGSAVISLNLKEDDAALIFREDLVPFEKMNPGPVKSIRQLWCSDVKFQRIPVFHKKTVPREVVRKILSRLINLGKEPDFKPYLPLMKQFKGKMVPISRKDYEPLAKLYKDAENNGWDREYRHWLSMVNE